MLAFGEVWCYNSVTTKKCGATTTCQLGRDTAEGDNMIKKILSKVGSTMSVQDYRNAAMSLCAANPFPFEQAIGSLGGASRFGVIKIVNGTVIRLK